MSIEKVKRIAHGTMQVVDASRVDYWIWRDEETGKWCGRCPAIEGAAVDNLSSITAVRADLSALVGRIMHNFKSAKQEPVFIEDHGFAPPFGAIHRKFSVSSF